jgi:exodeoxyribonuclease-5
MQTIELSADQQDAIDAILRWRANDPGDYSQYVTLGGYAGTGKTMLITRLAEEWPNTAVAAFCGKAADVLRSKGIVEAKTIHSLIYLPFKNADGAIRFRRRHSLEGVETLIIDEASMINDRLFKDLLSFNLPVLLVGDHGQLEPIGDDPGLMRDPDLPLERVHRQALDNPILRLATDFREGRPVSQLDDPQGRLRVASAGDFDKLISPDRQMIVGYNSTRHRVNAKVRKILGRRRLVEPGERLVCLRNNYVWGVFNGQQVDVVDTLSGRRDALTVVIKTDDGRTFALSCLKEQFGQNTIEDFQDQEVALMDYGYCLTAHKAQGSEWDNVLVKEEDLGPWDARRWRYTVATRAKERLIYCM